MRQLSEIIQLVAPRRVTVLISGETGTGKEVVARALHAASNRSSQAMIAVNCTALPATLVESELFGHAKGAFTGADRSRAGRFEQAHRGTIFLDEIGDLPLESQGKLLRVLQEQEFERLGGSETVRIDVRVVAATNVSLERAVKDRRFREDLFYRLNVVPIHMTPLRERREDIPLLLDYFLEKIRSSEGVQPKVISRDAVDYLMQQDWPGNVRQLEHTLQRAFALSGFREIIGVDDLSARSDSARRLSGSSGLLALGSPDAPAGSSPAALASPAVTVSRAGLDFDAVVSNFERSLLEQALQLSNGNKARAADLLRIKRTTLLAKMKALDCAISAAPAPATTPIRRVTSSAGTALVVESDAAVRKFVVKLLEQSGFRVMEAPTSAAALEFVENWASHLRLAVLPVASANSHLLPRLRRRAPGLAAIYLADYLDAETDPCANPSHGTETLLCPFSSSEFFECLSRLQTQATPALAGTACA